MEKQQICFIKRISNFLKVLTVAAAVLHTVCLGEPINIEFLTEKNNVYFSAEGNVPYNGEFIEEYIDGDGYSTGHMKNGKIHGEWKRFFHGGKLNNVGNYKDGKQQGEWKWFHYNGSLSKVGNYKNGKQQGEWKYFDNEEKMREIRNYKDGKRLGIIKSFDKNGNLIKFQPKTVSFFTDARDDKKYKYVKIGSQIWMAENLNYEIKGSSWCFGNKPENCAKYGRLYNAEASIEVCPEGWHLPSIEDWEKLIDFVSGIKEFAGVKLKTKNGWNSRNNGTDNYGFAALPGGDGYMPCDDGCSSLLSIGSGGSWWNSFRDSNYNDIMFHYYYIEDDGIKLYDSFGNPPDLHSVRCLQD